MPVRRRRVAELIALGNAVRRRRLDRGMTLDELSRESKVSRVMLVAIEHGTRNPGVGSIFDIADALGVRASDLIRDAEVDHGG